MQRARQLNRLVELEKKPVKTVKVELEKQKMVSHLLRTENLIEKMKQKDKAYQIQNKPSYNQLLE